MGEQQEQHSSFHTCSNIIEQCIVGFQDGAPAAVVSCGVPSHLNRQCRHLTHSCNMFNMGVSCLVRGAFASGGCFGVSTRKYAGACTCVAFLSGVKRYSQDTANRADVPQQFVCYHLPHRTLFKIHGQDTNPFLQGIITNDMGLLKEPGLRAMYSHMLNVQGRTLYDILLYR